MRKTKTVEQIQKELEKKEERVMMWEKFGIVSGSLDVMYNDQHNGQYNDNYSVEI